MKPTLFLFYLPFDCVGDAVTIFSFELVFPFPFGSVPVEASENHMKLVMNVLGYQITCTKIHNKAMKN